MNKITKVWFDEETGDMHEQCIDYYSIFNEKAGTRRTTMRLTREELQERFMAALPKATASRILGIDPALQGSDKTEWWGPGLANPNRDFNTVNYAGPQLNKAGLLEEIKRIHDDILNPRAPEPYYLTADLYDRMQAEGMALGGVTRMPKPPRYSVRPPAAAKSRAALHPLVVRLIDNLNKEN